MLVACRAAVDADSDTTLSEGSTHGSSDVLHALCAPLALCMLGAMQDLLGRMSGVRSMAVLAEVKTSACK